MRVLVVRLSALGDVVHTWPLAAALRAGRADLHLTWVVEEPLKPLVEGHPAVDSVVGIATRRWRRRPFSARTRRELAAAREQLRQLHPEVALDPQGLLKSAVVAWSSGAPVRIGLARPWRRERLAGLAYTRVVAGSRHPHVVATNLELLRAVGLEPPPVLPAPDGSWLAQAARHVDGPWRAPYAVVLPGAGRPAKVLAVETLAEVAIVLAEEGLEPVVAWGPGERERAAAVVAAAGGSARLAPPTDLLELAGLLAGASLAVGGDTGPVHLAASLGIPTLAVHLASSPARNGPLGRTVGTISAVRDRGPTATGSAAARRVRTPSADEIGGALRELLSRVERARR